MAVTEYIGMRYVPRFAEPAEWSSTREYEHLTIVLHNGNSFTSKKAVPMGIDIDNTEYWAETGNYNAQVEAYRDEVLRFDGRITGVEGDVGTLRTDLQAEAQARTQADTELQGNIDAEENARTLADNALRQDLGAEEDARAQAVAGLRLDLQGEAGTRAQADTALQEDIEALEDQIAALTSSASIYSYFKGFNVVFVGDSYTYGTGASDHLSGDTKRFSTILANRLQATEFNYGVGSTGFCDPGSGGQNAPFKTQVLTAAGAMTAEQRQNTHLVVIAGGVNDYNEGALYGAADMVAGASEAVLNARDNFPKALILVVPMLFKGHDANPRLLNFENAIIQGCRAMRCVYIQGAWTWNWGMSSHYASDKLHPNDVGHATIAAFIYSHIIGGSAYDNRLMIPTWESGFGSTSVDEGVYLQFYNGLVQSTGMIIDVRTTIEANTLTLIGTVPDGCVPLVNVCAMLMRHNEQEGILIITDNGNIYVRANTEISGTSSEPDRFFVAPLSYLPKGNL